MLKKLENVILEIMDKTKTVEADTVSSCKKILEEDAGRRKFTEIIQNELEKTYARIYARINGSGKAMCF